VKARSLLPRRWREALSPTAGAAARLSPRRSARAWSLEALEPRVLLSADPVLGAVQLAMLPADLQADPLDQAYSAASAAGPTMHALSVTLPNVSEPSPIIGTEYLLPNDSLRVDGNVSIEATAGNISIGTLGHGDMLSGNSSSTTDNLTLKASGNITINAAVDVGVAGTDELSSLTVLGAQNVSFKEAVTIKGDLTITATGTVTFDKPVALSAGGSLKIYGASAIYFATTSRLDLTTSNGVTPGDLVLQADDITLLVPGNRISGTGHATVMPTTSGYGMALFSAPGVHAGSLVLDNTAMSTFAASFASFSFGRESAGHAAGSSGPVWLGGTADSNPLPWDAVNVYGSSIQVDDLGASTDWLRVDAGSTLTLDAVGNVSIYNELNAQTLNLYSATGQVKQFDSVVDGAQRTNEPLRAHDLVAQAANGVSLTSLEAKTVDVVNTGANDITLVQNVVRNNTTFLTDITGDISITRLAQTAVSGANGISLLTQGGSITLAAGAGIAIGSSGALSLTAQGAGSDIGLLAPVNLVNGAATFNAADAFTSSGSATITASGASAISITSGTGALTLGAAVTTTGGSLSLTSGGALDLTGVTLDAGASGAITLQAAGDLKVGVVSATGSITLTSTGGGIVDALTGDAANLRGEAAAVTLTAANGVGTGSAPLRTAVGSLTASVSGASAGIFIAEETALAIAAGGLTTPGSGAIVVRNAAGDLTVAGPVHANGTGHILLEAITGNLDVAGDVLAEAGSISLLAGAALGVTGTEVRSRAANQTLDLRAGTSLSLGASTLLASVNAAQRLQAGGALALGGIDAGSGTVTVVAGGAVSSAAQSASITAAHLRLQAGGGIGSGAAPLQIKAAHLAASGAGSVTFNEFDDIAVGSVAEVAVNRVGSLGTVSATTPAGALAGLAATAGVLVLNAGGTVTLDAAASASSHLRLSAGTALNVNAGVSSSGGQLTLLAGGAIAHAAAGGLSTSGGAIDEQAGGALSFAAATTVSSGGGRLRLQSGGVLTLGQLNAGSGEAWLQGTRIVAAGGSSTPDLVAGDARLIATGAGAADGLGSSADPLLLMVQRLALQSAGAGGVHLAEIDAVDVDNIAASAGSRVQADGSTAALAADAALGGLTSAAGLLLNAGGDLNVRAGVSAQDTRLASANDLSLQAGLASGGVLSLEALRDLFVQGGITGSAGIDLLAGRDLLMTSGVIATAQGASLLTAARDMRVASVDVGATKALTVNAGGSLRDADAAGDTAVNLKAGKLVLLATAGIGQAGNAVETAATYLGASGGGGLFIDETDALAIHGALDGGTDFGTVQRVFADGVIATPGVSEVQGLSTGSAPLVLRLLGGALTVDAGVQSQGGAVRLEASGAVTLNAGVASSGGALSLIAGGAVQQAAAGSLASTGGSIDLQAAGGWTMTQGSSVATSGGALRLAATGALALAQLDAGSGAMSVTASQVKDLAGDAGSAPDLIASSLMLRTTGTAAANGVGAGSDAIDTAVQRLAVDTAGGGIFIAQSGDLLADGVAAFSGARVQLDGTLAAAAVVDAALAGLRSSAGLVLAGTGSLGVLAASSANGTVLLTSASDLSVAAALAGTAAMSLNAGRDLLLSADVSSSGSTRSLNLVAARDITQAQGAGLQTANGVIALQAGRDIALEALNAGTAGAALIATGSIRDGDAAGDAETDITAAALRLTAGEGVGTAANALETAVTSLSANAASLAITQAQALAIDRVATSLQRVAADGSTQSLDLGAQEDLAAANGALLLTVNSGDLTVNGGTASPAQAVNAGGALLLRAATGSLAVKAGVAAAGNASLRAGGELSFAAGGDVALAGAGSLDAEAGASIVMADGSVISSGSGSLRLAATVNLGIGALQTGGDVSLLARNITDAGGAETDVAARALRVQTTGTGTTQGFGTGAAPLQLQVATLAASVAGTGAGGFFAREADALAVDAVAVSVARVAADGSQSTQADAALSDLVSGGNVVLVLGGAGTLILNDGGNADGVALQSGGNVLLDAGGDLGVLAALRSSAGAVSLLAGASVTVGADVTITRTGRTLDVQAGGPVTMAATADLTTVDAAIRVQAGGDLTLGGIAAGLGQVSLISSGGSILAAPGHSGPEVSAASLRLSAAVGVGSSADRLDTAVQRVSARAAGGGIWLQEADIIAIDDVAVSVKRVSAQATTGASIDDATQSDLVTTGGNGSIALATANGSITFDDGTAPQDGRSITAHGTGTVSLKAGGAGAVVNAPAGAIEQQGPVLIDSGLKFAGAVSLTGGQGGGRGDGPVTISGAIDGTAGGAADRLVITSDGADVVFGGAIGATERLGGLAINDAGNVRFDRDVKLAGDLTLQAAGRVEFKGALDLSSGSLSIVGATELVIGNVFIASGNAVIRVDALTLGGLISGSAAARLEVAGAGTASGVTLGGAAATGLALTAGQLAALQGFGQVQIGRTDQGATSIDVGLLNTLVTPHLTLAGGSLSLQGGSTGSSGPHAGVQLLDLAAAQDLTLAGALALAAAGADVHATAGGALRMAADGVLATQAGDVRLQAGGDLRVGRIDTRASGGGATAAVVLASNTGTISETNADAAADVFADLLTLRGRGPALTGGVSQTAAALDVQASTLDVDAPSGVVLRDSGSDGHTAFNLLDGGQLYQQLIALGAAVRQPSMAAAPDQPSAAAADAWAWLNATRPLQDSRTTTLAATGAPTMSVQLAAPLRDAGPAAVFGVDPEPLLPSQLAALLRLDPAAPVAEPAQDSARFRVWSEELML
jgi:hypothetical protein